MPALQPWHTARLESEFTARDATPKSTLQDYLTREDQLFGELREKVYQRVEPAAARRDAPADRARGPTHASTP
jgi:hypothetical protein